LSILRTPRFVLQNRVPINVNRHNRNQLFILGQARGLQAPLPTVEYGGMGRDIAALLLSSRVAVLK
jgi:hypothetical protein